MWVINFKFVRSFNFWLCPGSRIFMREMYEKLIPTILREIKYHRDTLVPCSPRNFVGMSITLSKFHLVHDRFVNNVVEITCTETREHELGIKIINKSIKM